MRLFNSTHCPVGIYYFTQGQDKFRQGLIVRNPCEWSLFRLRYSCTWFFTVLVNGSFSYFKLQWLTKLFHYFLLHYQWPLIIEHRLDIRLNSHTLCSHDFKIHALLVSRITVSLYLCLRIQPSLLAPWCWLIIIIVSNLSNCELNMSLLYCVVKSSFFVHDLARFILLTLELKGLSMTHIHNYMKERGFHQSHL